MHNANALAAARVGVDFNDYLDETPAEIAQREKEEAVDSKLRRVLDDPKRARAKYLELVCRHSGLSHARFHVLVYLLAVHARPDLSNTFPSQRTVAAALKISANSYAHHLGALKTLGWVRTHEFQNPKAGTQTSSGVQFCIPRGVLPSGLPWIGPACFDNRSGAAQEKVITRTRGRLSLSNKRVMSLSDKLVMSLSDKRIL